MDQMICIWGGPFARTGLLAFWIAAGAFFIWRPAMTGLMLVAVERQALAER